MYIYIYTVGPPKSGHPMGHPLSEFWTKFRILECPNLGGCGVYLKQQKTKKLYNFAPPKKSGFWRIPNFRVSEFGGM